jgi:hypothetical protein
VFFSTNVTSKVVVGSPSNLFSEALLIIDEPASATNPNVPVLNCGNSGAPDNSYFGPGVCQSVSTGNPSSSYDGTPNGYGSAQCDGSIGRPAPNSYGCGRPNIFQAQTGVPQNFRQSNAITFFNVPIDPPGAKTVRTFRITNLRINAALIGANSTFMDNSVAAQISVTGPLPITIQNPQQIVAYIERSNHGAAHGRNRAGFGRISNRLEAQEYFFRRGCSGYKRQCDVIRVLLPGL